MELTVLRPRPLTKNLTGCCSSGRVRPSSLYRAPLKYISSWVNSANRFYPYAVVIMTIYALYVYCYLFCWNEFANNASMSTGVAYITISGVLAFAVAFTWSRILMIGPGTAARIPQYELGVLSPPVISEKELVVYTDEEALCGTSSPPEIFPCDRHGFPLWCSTCQSIKPDRVHHSVTLGYCVPKMDHYCIWIGAVIGNDNYRLFLQFVFYYALKVMFILGTLGTYAYSNFDRLLKDRTHYIILFGLGISWMLMLGGVLYVHIGCTLANNTTIDLMRYGRDDFPIFNFRASDGLRVVSRMRPNDPLPYDLGRFENWKLTMGPTILHWLLPIPIQPRSKKFQNYEYNMFNRSLLALFEQRYASGEEGYLAYPHLQIHQNTSSGILEEKSASTTISVSEIP